MSVAFTPRDSRGKCLRYPVVYSGRRLDYEICVVSGFRRGVNEIFALLGCYAAQIGSYRRFGTNCTDVRTIR